MAKALGIEALEARALLATVEVDLVNFAFSPSTVTIHVGDTVHWVWKSDNHSTTSVQGSAISWDSGVQNNGSTFDETFTQAGTFNYYCKIHGFDNHNGTAGGMSGTITVLAPSGIQVTPANPSVAAGGTQQFTAMEVFSDGSHQDVTSVATWSSSNTTAATISNTAGSNGLASALAAGTSTISAIDGSLTGSTVLTVTPALASIAVTPANPNLPKGETQQFVATGTRTDGSHVDLTSSVQWSSSSTAVAQVSTSGSSAGLATGLSEGSTTITATENGIIGSTSLTVTAPVLTGISVTATSPTVVQGSTSQFIATGIFSDQSTQILTSGVTWVSSTPAVASVSATGLATAASAGATTVTASFGGFSSGAALNVQPPPVTVTSIVPVKNKKKQVTAIDVFLSGAVNASEAGNKVTFTLKSPGKKNSFTAKNAKAIKLKSARYIAASNEITITPSKPIALTKSIQLTILGTPPNGLQDTFGRFFDGDGDGVAGGNRVVVISKKAVTVTS